MLKWNSDIIDKNTYSKLFIFSQWCCHVFAIEIMSSETRHRHIGTWYSRDVRIARKFKYCRWSSHMVWLFSLFWFSMSSPIFSQRLGCSTFFYRQSLMEDTITGFLLFRVQDKVSLLNSVISMIYFCGKIFIDAILWSGSINWEDQKVCTLCRDNMLFSKHCSLQIKTYISNFN